MKDINSEKAEPSCSNRPSHLLNRLPSTAKLGCVSHTEHVIVKVVSENFSSCHFNLLKSIWKSGAQVD